MAKTFAEVIFGQVARLHEADTAPVLGPPCMVVDVTDLDPMPEPGWAYVDGVFSSEAPEPAPAPPKPELVITSLVVDAPGWVTGSEATLQKGTTAKATGELRLAGLKTSLSAVFRMPIQANDGRERLILATLNEGVLSVEWTPAESGTWTVSEDAINRGLPAENHMSFAGLRLLVLD